MTLVLLNDLMVLSLSARVPPGVQQRERGSDPLPGREPGGPHSGGGLLLRLHRAAGLPHRPHPPGLARPRGGHPADEGMVPALGPGPDRSLACSQDSGPDCQPTV